MHYYSIYKSIHKIDHQEVYHGGRKAASFFTKENYQQQAVYDEKDVHNQFHTNDQLQYRQVTGSIGLPSQ
jgi:hypothetical protein